MKTSHIIIIIAVIIIGLLFFFGGKSEENTEVMEDENSEMMDETSHETEGMEDVVEATQPVPGSEADEMEVIDETVVTDTIGDKGGASDIKSFTVDAFSYGYSMEEIKVKQGDTVTINLTNSGGLHDWVVDEFDAATEKISEGGNTSVTFVADKKGTFEYYCSVGAHRAQGMVGNLIVE